MINSKHEKYNQQYRILRVLSTQDYLACDKVDQYFILSPSHKVQTLEDRQIKQSPELKPIQSHTFLIFPKDLIEIQGLKLLCYPVPSKEIQWIRNIPSLKFKSIPFSNKILNHSILNILKCLIEYDYQIIRNFMSLKNIWIYKQEVYLIMMKREKRLRVSLDRSEKKFILSQKSCGFNEKLANQLKIIKEFAIMMWDSLYDFRYYEKQEVQYGLFSKGLLRQMIKKQITFEEIIRLIEQQNAKIDILRERKKHRYSLLVRRPDVEKYLIEKENFTQKIKIETIQMSQNYATPSKKLSNEETIQHSQTIYQRYHTEVDKSKPKKSYLRNIFHHRQRKNSTLQEKELIYRRNSMAIQQIITRQSLIAKQRYNKTLQVRDDDKVNAELAQMKVRQLCKTISSKRNSKSQEKAQYLHAINQIRKKMLIKRISMERSATSVTDDVNLQFSKEYQVRLNSQTTPINKNNTSVCENAQRYEQEKKQPLKKRNQKLKLHSYVYKQFESPSEKPKIKESTSNSSVQVEHVQNMKKNEIKQITKQIQQLPSNIKDVKLSPKNSDARQKQLPKKKIEEFNEVKQPVIGVKNNPIKKTRRDKSYPEQDDELEEIVLKSDPKQEKPANTNKSETLPRGQDISKPEGTQKIESNNKDQKKSSKASKTKEQPSSQIPKSQDVTPRSEKKSTKSKNIDDLIDQILTLINIVGDVCVKSVKMKDKLKSLQWKLGSFFLYERFLYERKKIEKKLENSEKFSRIHRKLLPQDWEEWLKLPSRKTLLGTIQHENTIIESTLKKLGNRILQECKLERKVEYYIRNREAIEKTNTQKARSQLSKYIAKSIADEYDQIIEKNIKDQQVQGHIMDMVFALRIIGELDGKVKRGDPYFPQINEYKQYRYSFQELEKVVDILYDLYFPPEEEE